MSKLLYRYSTAAPTDLKEADGKRTLTVAFSSETPVLSGEYYEVLSHDRAHADFSMLKNGAFLDQHNPERQPGGIEEAWLDARDRKGRAILSFGNTTLGNERYELMSTGLRTDVSVGYELTKQLSETRHADGKPIKRFAWKAHEISSVAVPADKSCGVGRSSNNVPKQSRNKIEIMNEKEIKTEIFDLNKAVIHNRPDLEEEIKALETRALIKDSITIREYKADLMKLVQDTPAPANRIRAVDHTLNLNKREVEKYSFQRFIRGMYENKGAPQGYEKELSDQVAKNCGESPEGAYIPAEIVFAAGARSYGRRDLQAEVFGSGGALVPTILQMNTIDLLRNRMICGRLGATILGGCSGNVAYSRQDSTVTVAAVSEIAAFISSQLSLSQLLLSPKRVGASTTYSKQLVFQSSPDAEGVIRDDMFLSTAEKHDYLLLNGSGSNSEPMGIFNTPGVGSLIFGGSATFAELIQFETLVSQANADTGQLAYASTPGTRGKWKGTAVALTGATTVSSRSLWEKGNFPDGENDGLVNDYRAAATNQILNNLVLFGNWSDLIYASWGGFDVVVDYVTQAKNAEIVLTLNTWMDAALRHAQSFVASADAGNQ